MALKDGYTQNLARKYISFALKIQKDSTHKKRYMVLGK